MNTKQKIIYTGVIALTLILSGQFQIVEAAKVDTTIEMPYQMSNNLGASFNGMAVMKPGGTFEDIFDSTTRIKIDLSKTFHFVKEDKSYAGSTPTLSIGKTLTANVSGTTGSWGVFGADSTWSNAKNLSFGNDIYRNMARQSSQDNKITTNVFAPYDNQSVRIDSSNPSVVSCTNSVCTAVSGGTANVVVSFNKRDLDHYESAILNIYKYFFSGTRVDHTTTVFPYPNYKFFGSNNAYGKVKVAAAMDTPTSAGSNEFEIGAMKTVTYDFPSVAYTITVSPATATSNQPQTVSCAGFDTITGNSVNIKWTYTDPENDPQANYVIQVATNSIFTQGVIQAESIEGVNVPTTSNRIFTGLTPGVTYYARVAAYNTTNNWSAWSSCSGSFKTISNGPHVVTYDTTNPIASNSATVRWTYSDPENDAQTEYEVGLSLLSNFNSVPFVKTGTGTALNASFTGLVPNTKYYVRVRAKNAVNGMSTYSTGNFTTPSITGVAQFYCATGDPVQPLRIPEEVTYSAYPKMASYVWHVPNSAGSSDSEYYKTYTSLTDNTNVSVDITKDGITNNIECPRAILTCGAQTSPTQCDVNNKRTVYSFNNTCQEVGVEEDCGLEPVTVSATFSINPDVADASGSCYFSVISENAYSCWVTKNRTSETVWPYPTSIITTATSDESIGVGTYTLYCKQTVNSIPKSFGIKSCYSNPDIREN